MILNTTEMIIEDLDTMTIEDDERLDKFLIENKDKFLLPYPADDSVLMWDDFEDVKTMIKNRSDLHIMTIVTGDDDTAWICDGWHIVNRIGYYLLTEAPSTREDIRYW